jgi:hypothetical protein
MSLALFGLIFQEPKKPQANLKKLMKPPNAPILATDGSGKVHQRNDTHVPRFTRKEEHPMSRRTQQTGIPIEQKSDEELVDALELGISVLGGVEHDVQPSAIPSGNDSYAFLDILREVQRFGRCNEAYILHWEAHWALEKTLR